MSYGAFDAPGVSPDSWGASGVGQLTWDARTGRWDEENDLRLVVDLASVGLGGVDSFVIRGPEGFTVVGPDGPRLTTLFDSRGLQATPVPSRGGARLAAISAPDETVTDDADHPVLVADVSEEEKWTRARRVPGTSAHDVLGWRGDGEVVLRRARDPLAVVGVDTTTGVEERLMTLPYWRGGTDVVVAAGAWSSPVVEAVEPDWPMSTVTRQLLVAGGVAVLVLVLAAGWWWRRGRA